MSNSLSIPKATQGGLHRAIRNHWRIFVAEGIILCALGLAAIVIPSLGSLAVTIVLGWVFFFAGVAGILASYMTPKAPGILWSLLSALAALVAGSVLLLNPFAGVLTLTVVLAAFFIMDGVFNIVLAINYRRQLSGKWEWMVLNGFTDLLLAAVVIVALPGSAAWVLGLIVGIDMVFGGLALVAIALDARKRPLSQVRI